tara:strand:+ start:1405 stop:1524 length:120 start_codon:yes stop_codon:yes gene_type:complete
MMIELGAALVGLFIFGHAIGWISDILYWKWVDWKVKKND